MQMIVNNVTINLIQGDITKQTVDAIVNAANPGLMGGGGVDGAIHRAGGPAILEECKAIVKKKGRLPTGEAVITTAGDLNAKYVIHTVGPVWQGGMVGEVDYLMRAYLNCMKLGAEKKIESIAFPSISTGVYGFPVEPACAVALKSVTEFIKNARHNYKEVQFLLFSKEDFDIYCDLIKELIKEQE